MRDPIIRSTDRVNGHRKEKRAVWPALLERRSENTAHALSDHFPPFSTIFSIFRAILKGRLRDQRGEFPRREDAVQDKAHRDQDLFRAMDPRRSRHFRASIHGPMTGMMGHKRGIPAPLRLVSPNIQGIASSAARTLRSERKKKRIARTSRREGVSRVELGLSRSRSVSEP